MRHKEDKRRRKRRKERKARTAICGKILCTNTMVHRVPRSRRHYMDRALCTSSDARRSRLYTHTRRTPPQRQTNQCGLPGSFLVGLCVGPCFGLRIGSRFIIGSIVSSHVINGTCSADISSHVRALVRSPKASGAEDGWIRIRCSVCVGKAMY